MRKFLIPLAVVVTLIGSATAVSATTCKNCTTTTTTSTTSTIVLETTTTSTVPGTTTTVAPTTTVEPTTTTTSTTTTTVPVDTRNCDEVGVVNILPDNPLYREDLDGDKDGIACEEDIVLEVIPVPAPIAFTG